MHDLYQILPGFGLALIVAVISYYIKALTKSGAIGAIIIGTVIFGLGGPVFALPLLVFFISGSLLSYLKSESKSNALKLVGKTGPRDIWQVLANGGLAGIITIIFFIRPDQTLFFAYLSAISEATADTWATEIGMMSKKQPVSIISLKRILPGESGGITLMGTLASSAGSFFIAFSGLLIWPPANHQLFVLYAIFVSLVGFLGAVIDSILGATIQGQYYCRYCLKRTEKPEHCGQPADLVKNFNFINNDMVNLLSTFASIILYFMTFYLYLEK